MTALRSCSAPFWVWTLLLAFSGGCEKLSSPLPSSSTEAQKPKPEVVIAPTQPPVQAADPKSIEPVAPPKPDAKVVIATFMSKQAFDVTDNDLEALASMDEEGLAEIKDLKLQGTRVTAMGLGTLAKFGNLESLHLSKTTMGNDALQRLKELQAEGHLGLLNTLELEGMQINDSGLRLLTKLGQIKHLNLASTPISDAGLEICRFMPELESLNVAQTQINGFGFKWLKGHLGFKKLDAPKCPLQERWLIHLKGLPIEYLNLGQCGITDQGLIMHIKTIKELRHLFLAFNRLSDAGISSLKTLTNLETLHFQDCEQVTDAGLYQIRNLKRLRSVAVGGNRCTANGAEGLKKFIPDLDVRF
jgi:Leucine Rich Repeat (LRR) protein